MIGQCLSNKNESATVDKKTKILPTKQGHCVHCCSAVGGGGGPFPSLFTPRLVWWCGLVHSDRSRSLPHGHHVPDHHGRGARARPARHRQPGRTACVRNVRVHSGGSGACMWQQLARQ